MPLMTQNLAVARIVRAAGMAVVAFVLALISTLPLALTINPVTKRGFYVGSG